MSSRSCPRAPRRPRSRVSSVSCREDSPSLSLSLRCYDAHLTTGPPTTPPSETCGYRDAEDQLGGLPLNRTLFRNKHFIVTAPEVTRHSATSNDCFSDLPFDLDHLLLQLRYGGATIYEHFEEVPKGKYKSCVVITREPCLTARYIQCLAVNMVAVSHGWVIECCRQNQLVDLKAFALPAGWSMVEGKYVRYVTGRNEKRANAHPFMGLSVLISSENDDFIKFWTRVCKFGDAKVKAITSVLDITAGKKTYLLTDSELEVANVEKAKAVGMPIVSTAWVSECLIQGRPVQPEEHPNFTKANWDLS